MPDTDISKWTGEDISDYLTDLDSDSSIELTDWEASFVASNMNRTSFSEKQRKVVADLVKKYGDDLES